jgi:hypothetical protein
VVVGAVIVARIVLNGAGTPDADRTVFIVLAVVDPASVVDVSKNGVLSNSVVELPWFPSIVNVTLSVVEDTPEIKSHARYRIGKSNV